MVCSGFVNRYCDWDLFFSVCGDTFSVNVEQFAGEVRKKMKVLIVYYSRTGRNRELAELMKQKLLGDLDEVVDKKNRGGFWGWLFGGMDAVLKRLTEIKAVGYEPGKYNVVVLIYPIWAGVMPPAIRTYVRKFKESLAGRRVAVVSVSSQGSRNERAVGDLEAAIGKKTAGSLWLTVEEFKEGSFRKDLEALVRKLMGKRQDLGQFLEQAGL